MVPLKYKLQTGERVEITPRKGHWPSKDWLGFCQNGQSQVPDPPMDQDPGERAQRLALGREMCEKAFRKYRLNFNTLVKSEEMQAAVAGFGLKSVEDLIVSVGYGKITPLQVVRKVAPKSEDEQVPPQIQTKTDAKIQKENWRRRGGQGGGGYPGAVWQMLSARAR
jgi:guanosine-3',5'-bis(diphosphate) 3'-pyrophosphohydrolase